MAAMPELKIEVESKDSLSGDTILVRLNQPFTPNAIECIKGQLKDKWPEKTVLILEPSISLEIASLDYLRSMRDGLNEAIYDLERKR